MSGDRVLTWGTKQMKAGVVKANNTQRLCRRMVRGFVDEPIRQDQLAFFSKHHGAWCAEVAPEDVGQIDHCIYVIDDVHVRPISPRTPRPAGPRPTSSARRPA